MKNRIKKTNKINNKKSILKSKESERFSSLIGKSFFFRAVTYHCVGLVEKNLFGNFLKLKNASWVAESARFMNSIQDGELNEVEPVGDMFLNMETVVDFCPWNHDLPTEQK